MDKLETAENTSDQTHFNTILPSFLQRFKTQSVIPSENLSAKQETIPQEGELKQDKDEVKIAVNSYLRSILSRNSQLSNQFGKERIVVGFENLKLKLSFINQIAPTIFTNNEIKAKNGKPLLVAICDNTTNSNAIIKTGVLSSALVEFLVLDGEFGFNLLQEKNCWSWNDFNKSIVSERVGKRPLIVGNDKIICLENGVGKLNGLSFSDNSSWTKTKKFRLGVKVVAKEILANFPTIQEAVSEPFRVMDQRGEGYKKHHPPSREDEIWRLEGIGKNGAYHKRLSSNEIKNVDDFLKTYKQKGPTYLKKLLGEKVPNKTWTKMISNALECDSMGNEANLNNLEDGELYHQHLPSFNPIPRVSPNNHNLMDRYLEVDHGFTNTLFSYHELNLLQQHLGDNYEAMRGQGFEGMGEQDNHFVLNDDYLPLLPHGEASTSYNHNYKAPLQWGGA